MVCKQLSILLPIFLHFPPRFPYWCLPMFFPRFLHLFSSYYIHYLSQFIEPHRHERNDTARCLHSSFLRASYWSYNLHVAENPSNQSKTRRLSVHWCALHPGTKSADIIRYPTSVEIRGSTENPHRRLARLLRKIVKSMALQLLNLLCPAFLYKMCTALEWCITPTQSGDLLYQPIQIHPVYSIRLWGLVLVDHVCPCLPARVPWLQGVSGA